MPNTLVHFAAQGTASRGIWRRVDARWIFLGCLLPDLPWILRRVAVGFEVPANTYDLRLYTMAQASLAVTLLLCAALALVTVAPRLVFGILGLNALLHLLIDATEIKWGNGVHLLAPFSWRMTSFDLINGEGRLILVFTVLGALLVGWEIARWRPPAIRLDLRPKRLALAAVLGTAYLLVPLAFLDGVEASDSYSVKTLREVSARPGRTVGLDRTSFIAGPNGGTVEMWNGERLRVTGPVPDHDARVSLYGTFLEPDLLRVDRYVEHRRSRDWPSYLALLLLAALWLRPLLPVRRAPAA
ncbi:MAG: hypothetical protein LJF30_15040 [Acidobacteria bacterium]|nr:hypothetical protein [Acidobacteriota bacterium]